VVQVDVVRRCSAGVKADCLSYHEGDCLGLGFAYGLGGGGAAFCLVQHLVRQFMHKGWELLGRRLAGKQGDLASVAHAKSGSDVLFELQRDAPSNDKIHKAVAVLSSAAGDAFGEFWKLRPFGLAYIEDIGGAEPNQNGLILCADVLLGFFALLPANPDYGSEDTDAVLTLLDLATKLVPRIEASNACCVRRQPCDLQKCCQSCNCETYPLR
jgi:hypothetical protein